MPEIPQSCWDLTLEYLGTEKDIAKDAKRDWRFEECRACVNRLLKNLMLICTGWVMDFEANLRQIDVCRNYAKVIEARHLTLKMRRKVVIAQVRIHNHRGTRVDRQKVAMVATYRACTNLLRNTPMYLVTHPRQTYFHLRPFSRRVR